MVFALIEGLSEVFQMFVYLFLRDTDLGRYLLCRKLIVLKQGQYLPPDRLPPGNRYKGLLGSLPHSLYSLRALWMVRIKRSANRGLNIPSALFFII